MTLHQADTSRLLKAFFFNDFKKRLWSNLMVPLLCFKIWRPGFDASREEYFCGFIEKD